MPRLPTPSLSVIVSCSLTMAPRIRPPLQVIMKSQLITVLLLLLLVMLDSVASAQHVLPCPFNAMCSCKMAASSTNGSWALPLPAPVPAGRGDEGHPFAQQEDAAANPIVSDLIRDVSCVGVPFAALPELPAGRITHVDVVSSGLEVADVGYVPAWDATREQSNVGPQIESLRLMSNRIRVVGDYTFTSMAHALQSLDFSYNELDEFPAQAIQALQVLDWANFHSNKIASLDGLANAWNHMGKTLTALFLGNNELVSLPRGRSHIQSSRNGGHYQPQAHGSSHNAPRTAAAKQQQQPQHSSSGGHNPDSLANLRHLNWLNLDGNQLTDIASESLPSKLHTLSLAHNRLVHFPSSALEGLRELRWLDLRGNLVKELPSWNWRTGSTSAASSPAGGWRLRVDKLDLGENLISKVTQDLVVGVVTSNRSHPAVAIRDLHLDYNRLTELPATAFRGTSIARLYLAGNKLRHMDERAFTSLASHLVLLDLERNELSEVPRAVEQLKRLRFLYLSNNRLSHLRSDSLAAFGPYLEALGLAGNHFITIPSSALKWTPNLLHLNLGYNRIDNLSPGDFTAWAKELDTLILRGNSITALHAGVFKHTPKLRELSLSFNKLSDVHPEALTEIGGVLESLDVSFAFWQGAESSLLTHLLKPLVHLQWLALDHNEFRHLPRDAFRSLGQLRLVNLEANRLTTASLARVFTVRHQPFLRELRLAYNQLETVPAQFWVNFTDLQSVTLSFNHVQNVETRAFHRLPSLVTLSLSHNKLQRLEPGALSHLPKLAQLDLQFNRVEILDLDMFDRSTNPWMPLTLNLSDNFITQVAGSAQGDRLHIKTLDLTRNQLVDFPTAILAQRLAPMSLRKLLLSHNQVTRLENLALSTCCPSLQILELRNNDLEFLGRTALKGAAQLQIVVLSQNQIEYVPNDFFVNLTRLRILDLSHNRLRSLPRDVFQATALESLSVADNAFLTIPATSLGPVAATLSYLDLSGNQIEHLDAMTFAHFPNLLQLNLARNRVSLLPDNVFAQLGTLLTLDLSFNPIRANFKELFHYLQKLKDLHLAYAGLVRWPALPLPHLITLNLSGNALEYTPASSGPTPIAPVTLDSLRTWDLSRNKLSVVPALLWSQAPLLKHLDLAYNPIRLLNRESFTSLSRLQILNLQPLPMLEHIDADSFSSLYHLHTLRMQHWPGPSLSTLLTGLHGIKKLAIDFRVPALASQLADLANPQVAPKLRELEITGQHLRLIHPDALARLGLYTAPHFHVSIHGTLLRQLPDGLLSGLEGVASLGLDLRHNQLQTLTRGVLQPPNISDFLSHTRHLSGGLWLDDNPWLCNCDLAWMSTWLRRWLRETQAVDPAILTDAFAGSLRNLQCVEPGSALHNKNKRGRVMEMHGNADVHCHVAALSSAAKPRSSSLFWRSLILGWLAAGAWLWRPV